MPNVVGERYQITIDKKVRQSLGIQPGDLAIEHVEDGRMVVYFAPKAHRASLLGALKRPGAKAITDWDALKDEARRRRSDEIIDALRG